MHYIYIKARRHCYTYGHIIIISCRAFLHKQGCSHAQTSPPNEGTCHHSMTYRALDTGRCLSPIGYLTFVGSQMEPPALDTDY